MNKIKKAIADAKSKHPGAICLFKCGDFYESFGEDASKIAGMLGLPITYRDKEFPMCGFPDHHLPAYLAKMLQYGVVVAVLDQVA